MNKKIAGLVMSALIIGTAGTTYGTNVSVETNIPGLTFTATAAKGDPRPVSMKEFFTQYCNTIGYGIPDVFRQIPLRIPGVKREDTLYQALQKCVYLGFVPNSSVDYKRTNPVSSRFVNIFVSKTLQMDPNINEDEQNLSRTDFGALIDALPNYRMLLTLGNLSRWGANSNYQSQLITTDGFGILSEIYQMIKNDYRTGVKVSDEILLQGAIRGMTQSIGDTHTEFFPPTEAQEFNDQLNGNFEGIGAYLDLQSPGMAIITSVLKDSPAQKAGLQANDRIVKVDEYVISEKDALDAVISRVKGPAGTTVKLTIQRGMESKIYTITRAKLVISMLDYEMKGATPVLSLHSFGWGIAGKWIEMLTAHKITIQNSPKIIIDLRNNPGGSLQDVADILSDFVPKDQPVVITQSRYEEDSIVSAGRNIVDFSKKKIVILINSATASASEIMAGTLKDYFPQNVVIVGETSYGKGSVQYLQSFANNSSFKLTIAHWYTGKTKKAIEHVGIVPDVEVALDLNQLKNGTDTQMQAALMQ